MRKRPSAVSLLLWLPLVMLSTGCATGGAASDGAGAHAASGGGDASRLEAGDVDGAVVVFAAASLSDAFADLEAAFEDENPDADVQLNVSGSAALREQILEGAPADVFASADERIMSQLVDAGEVASEPETFARNRLEIAVPAANPGGVTSLEDLAEDDLLIGLCAAAVPCGDFARQALSSADVTASVDTNEPDVRALLTKIAADELDAGIVYVTDVAAASGLVEGIEIPPELNVEAAYPIADLARSSNPAGARAFIDFVLSSGQPILARRGFSAP